jgi:hypothetical protein
MTSAPETPPPPGAPDWFGLVDGWIAEGLVDGAHRDALVRRLEAVRLPSANPTAGLFATVAIVALVTAGLLLIDGSVLTTLALLNADEQNVAAALAVLGLIQGIAGVPIRLLLHRGVGHGFGSAGVMAALTGLLGLGLAERSLEPVCLIVGMGIFLGTTLLAVVDDAPGLAAAAGLGVTMPLLAQLDADVASPILLAGSLAWVVLASAAAVVDQRIDLPGFLGTPSVLGAQTPFAAFIGSVAILLHGRWLLSGWNGSAYESAILLALFGGLILLAGWAATSRVTLVSGLGVILTAQLPVLWALESLELALVAFGLEGLGLLGIAVLAVLVAARRKNRESAG